MRNRIEIDITSTDCDEGVRGNVHNCVVHMALLRVVPEATHSIVDVQTIRFTIEEDGERHRYVYLTPRKVRDYIIAFDAGDPPSPMSFTLEKPQVTTVSPRPVGAAKTATFRATKRGTGERRSLRVFGERSFRINQDRVS